MARKGNVRDLITYEKIFIEESSISIISKRLSWKKQTQFRQKKLLA